MSTLPRSIALGAILSFSLFTTTTAQNHTGLPQHEIPTSKDWPSASDCGISARPCGPYCCHGGQYCTVDINAVYTCCTDPTDCTATVTGSALPTSSSALPTSSSTNAAKRDSVPAVFSHIAGLTGRSPASYAPVPNRVIPSPTLHAANSAATTLPGVNPVCTGPLVKEWQLCCVSGTMKHYYSTGEHGCCSSDYQGKSDVEIEKLCPVAVGMANLRPLGDGVVGYVGSSGGWRNGVGLVARGLVGVKAVGGYLRRGTAVGARVDGVKAAMRTAETPGPEQTTEMKRAWGDNPGFTPGPITFNAASSLRNPFRGLVVSTRFLVGIISHTATARSDVSSTTYDPGCIGNDDTQHISWHSGQALYEIFVPMDGQTYDVATDNAHLSCMNMSSSPASCIKGDAKIDHVQLQQPGSCKFHVTTVLDDASGKQLDYTVDDTMGLTADESAAVVGSEKRQLSPDARVGGGQGHPLNTASGTSLVFAAWAALGIVAMGFALYA